MSRSSSPETPEAVVKSLAQRTNGVILGMHYVHEAQRLMTVTHPIQGWYVTGSRYDENSIVPVSTVDLQGNSNLRTTRNPQSTTPITTRPNERCSAAISRCGG